MKYSKPALSYADQRQRLIDRGLTVSDPASVDHWLRHISYYRLSAYALPFKSAATKQFLPGTEFGQITNLYRFDCQLRMTLLDAIERVEIAVRSEFVNAMGYRYGPFGYTDASNFDSRFRHAAFLAEIKKEEGRSRETFVAHFRNKYTSETHLPIWMAAELISFGGLSQTYGYLAPEIKRGIANKMGTVDVIAGSWLHSLSYVRNLCAHHQRLWNRTLGVRPKLPTRSKTWPYEVTSNEQLYCIMVILRHVTRRVSPDCGWGGRLKQLLANNPAVPLSAMGIPANWCDLPLWAE